MDEIKFSMSRTGRVIVQFLMASLIGLFLVSCIAAPTPSPSPTTTLTPTPEITATAAEVTPLPTSTATPEPPGSPDNPLVIGLVPAQPDPQAADQAAAAARLLEAKTGLTIHSKVFETYPLLLAALSDHKIQLAFLPPMTYIQAHQRGLADVALLSNHFGVYSYGTQFLAHVDSQFTPYFDRNADKSIASAEAALQQFAGKRPCWVEPKSVSGYVLPAGMLADLGITTLEPAIVQSFGGVVRALYIQQICDFGATFAISGDPRTASSLEDNLPDLLGKVIVIWRTDAFIPNLNVSYSPGLPAALRQQLNDALQAVVKTEAGKAALTGANQYDIQEFKPVDDATYDMLRLYQKALGVDLKTLVGR